MTSIGIRIFGASAVATGVVGLTFGDFATIWQPVPEEIPGRAALAYLAAVLFIVAGALLQRYSTVKTGAVVLVSLAVIFALLWSRRIVYLPLVLGTWSGTAEQVVLAVAGVLAFLSIRQKDTQGRRLLFRICLVIFSLCLISFGLAHFQAIDQTAAMVPSWLPPGQKFWAYLTGACHVLAGLSIISNVRALLAARLLTLMFIGFSLLVWIPSLLAAPTLHVPWAGNAINLSLIGAAWIVTESIARSIKEPVHRRQNETTSPGDDPGSLHRANPA